MRRAVTAVAAACLLLGPTVLAFFSGGYFAEPRLIAALAAWALVLALALTGRAPLPTSRAGIVAVAGLALMTVWTAASIAWAPLGGPAAQSAQRLMLYLAALLIAIDVLRSERIARAVEPAVAGGITLVIGYGLAGRLLPGIIELSRSRAAGGRLEQPITYWNAEGALAAVGFVLAARIAGDAERPRGVRAAAAAAAAPLAAGVYLSFSRGAIAAALLGVLVLAALAPTRAQLRAAALAVAVGIAGALAAAVFPGVSALEGATADREREGLVVLGLLLLLAGHAAVVSLRHAPGDGGRPPWAAKLRPVAGIAACLVVLGLLIGALGERPSQRELARGADAGRLGTVSSNRYEYWRIGLDAFARKPLTGLGAGGFRVEWLKQRSFAEAVKDTHSIEVEMAAELGIVGLLALGLLVGGIVAAARTALRRRPDAAAGAAAASIAFLLHASIDWDWQLPAVALPALTLAGLLVAISERAR